jgi:hypothetical protein
VLGSCAGLLLLATTLAPPSEPSADPAPGGYWSVAEQRQRRGEPPDGHDELTIGSVLFSLGLLRTGAAGITIWMARTPGKCPVRPTTGCQSMEIYGWLGFGEGGLMVGTGLTYLIIGAVRQNRHRRWKAGENVALPRTWVGVPQLQLELGPWMIPVGGGAQLRWRF